MPSHAHFVMSYQLNDGDDTCKSEGEVLSAGAVAGIAVIVTLLLALPMCVGVVLGVAWNITRRGSSIEGHQQKSQQVQGPIYEEPPETTIPLSDNQAYGTQRNNS